MELAVEMDALIPCTAVPQDTNYRKQVLLPPFVQINVYNLISQMIPI